MLNVEELEWADAYIIARRVVYGAYTIAEETKIMAYVPFIDGGGHVEGTETFRDSVFLVVDAMENAYLYADEAVHIEVVFKKTYINA